MLIDNSDNSVTEEALPLHESASTNSTQASWLYENMLRNFDLNLCSADDSKCIVILVNFKRIYDFII